ncbi:3-isopropylmalate dehydratase small subunit [Cyanobium sp. Maggiore-St4-Cus]|uniref:3-isopropylmalate dehydratase small subunit n=1 Tax=Cyanobium sp. Maggiore-St4-Cus TaxID=2823717 RepID=UPI0020CF8E5E|nr:3-isopropylmalate dehydratase small subunit [Cyanobium sp. Maggiore-St4-Cus]MCF8139705.1 3-isopropylmalate dehydratase small subunit [Cyanobium usitatum Tobar12.5m-G36]MCP9789248.1 3-isopropylmalate dehydratase small subunit [Cyanobium sp. Maggiore-St4-Cus]
MTTSSFPFGPISAVRGRAVVIAGDDIDTDRIIPARFLKCVTFDGLGEQVFADDRAELSGEHPFDRAELQGASVLVVNRNFGCGSSREHAPQALMRWGIRAVVGESFAEIFYGNCLALGIPCFTSSHASVLSLQESLIADPGQELSLSLAKATLEASRGQLWQLELQSGPQQMLASGQWDATSQLLANDGELARTAALLPYINGF